MTRCSICHTRVLEHEEVQTCRECGQAYHAECWRDNGGCATYGCPAAPAGEKPILLRHAGAGWGDEKTCPACGATLPAAMLGCRCGAIFPWADPITPPEYADWLAKNARRRETRRLLVVLFVLAILAIPAPIAGGVAAWVARSRRDLMTGPDGTFLALGWGTAVIGATWTLVFAALAMGA